MRSCLARKFVAFVIALAQSLSFSLIAFAQQGTPDEIRPRRINEAKTQPSPTPSNDGEWKAPATESPASVIERAVLSPGPEPKIRVGLATDVRGATVSTSGRLMQTTEDGATLVALDVARVRLEPRLLSPLPPISPENAFRLRVAGAATRSEAEDRAREIKEAVGEESQVTFDLETKTWGLLVGARLSRTDAEQLSERLNDAGFDASVFQSTPPGVTTAAQTANNQAPSSKRPAADFRLAARTSVPSREVVALGRAQSAVSARALLWSSGPTTRESFPFVTTIALIAAASKCLQTHAVR